MCTGSGGADEADRFDFTDNAVDEAGANNTVEGADEAGEIGIVDAAAVRKGCGRSHSGRGCTHGAVGSWAT